MLSMSERFVDQTLGKNVKCFLWVWSLRSCTGMECEMLAMGW